MRWTTWRTLRLADALASPWRPALRKYFETTMSVASCDHVGRDLGAFHLEDDRAVGVGDDAGAALPHDRVERIGPDFGVAAGDDGAATGGDPLLRLGRGVGARGLRGAAARGARRRFASRLACFHRRTLGVRTFACPMGSARRAIRLAVHSTAVPYDRRLRHVSQSPLERFRCPNAGMLAGAKARQDAKAPRSQSNHGCRAAPSMGAGPTLFFSSLVHACTRGPVSPSICVVETRPWPPRDSPPVH